MKETGVLFGDEMVRRILDGTKTQTRRPIKFPKHAYCPDLSWIHSIHQDGGGNWVAWSSAGADLAEFTKQAYPDAAGFPCSLGQVGDRIYVKETFAYVTLAENEFNSENRDHRRMPDIYPVCMFYRADGYHEPFPCRWTPSIFMPRWASRLTLEIVALRAQQVQEISYDDIVAEGWNVQTSQPFTDGTAGYDAREWFRTLWDSIYAKQGFGFDVNPWVWAATLQRVESVP